MIRLLRDEVVVFDGKIASLKHLQNDVKEVKAGYECGIGLESFQDIKPGDILEVYKIEEWYPAGTQEYQTRPDWEEFRKTSRWEFTGKVADEIRDQYIGKFVGKGGQNPIRYRNI